MAIENKDLVIFASERLTDTTDGGGKYSGRIIEDGLSNNLFPDISELDGTMGDVAMRKIFPAVITDNTDSLMGATIFISEVPTDPNVSALLFSTENWTDERSEAQNRVENYLAKGGQTAGTPLDTHWQGMKQLQVCMFPQEVEASNGDTIVLISNEGKSNAFEQYLRITKVETRSAIIMINDKQIEYKVATYDISDPLERDFTGLSARQWYSGDKSVTIVRDTLVADTGNYFSSTQLASDASVGEYTVNASSMFTQLVPSAQTESPIVDVNAAGESIILVAGNDGVITADFSTTVSTAQNLYIGSSVMPSSMSFMLFGQSITDQGGLLKNTTGTQVGTIDYQRGLIQWTASATTGAATLAITFKPAAAPNQYYQSHSIPVTQNNQSSNWTGILIPIPTPGSLSVSYMSQGKFYTLKDDGSGQLKGSSSVFGSGRIDYETGSWLLTTGALPDVGAPILLNWGTPIVTFVRSSLSVEKASFEFDLEMLGVLPGVTINWLLEGVAQTATSNAQGKFSGDAVGDINYAKGAGKIIPNKLPQKGTIFNIIFNYGTSLTQTKNSISPDANQKLTFTIGTGSSIQPNSIGLEIPLESQTGNFSETVYLVDVPINATTGNLVNSQGRSQGVITYATGVCEVTPIATKNTFVSMYTPMATYRAA